MNEASARDSCGRFLSCDYGVFPLGKWQSRGGLSLLGVAKNNAPKIMSFVVLARNVAGSAQEIAHHFEQLLQRGEADSIEDAGPLAEKNDCA